MNYNNIEYKEPFINNNKKVYLFWASWCGHCKKFKPIFNDFKNQVSNNKNIKIIDIQSDDPSEEINKLINKFNITGFPTVVIENNDNHFISYPGVSTKEKLLSYIN